MTILPSNIIKTLSKLSSEDQETVKTYIASLQAKISELGGSFDEPMDAEEAQEESSPSSSDDEAAPDYKPKADTDADVDAAMNFKQQATDAKEMGKFEDALEYYTKAVMAAEPTSALLYVNRALCLEKLGRISAAVVDCNRALKLNPDSAKALKTRGKLRYQLVQASTTSEEAKKEAWHGALSDLSQAQSIDFDPSVAEMLKELTELRKQEEQEQAKERLAKEEKLRKQAEEIKKAREAQQAEEAAARAAAGGGMPGGMGGMGGMPGMGGAGMPPGMDPSMMTGLMSDPELQEAMKNPKVVAAFSELMSGPGGPMGLMSNPAKLQELMADPDVGPVLQKLMGKFMGGGMPAGGASPFGAPGGSTGDDIPDLGDMPDLD
eukprot:Nitzschia sp. Nitz4//scaffold21_size171442//50469//51687//NITZ4_002154-RA/size171442-processed-gene-0.155-mRNA-1//-1//CDS//3329542390//2280//frame0